MDSSRIKEIILVDDEPGILLALKLLLSALGYTALDFSDPEAALKSLPQNSTSQLIISDLRMPRLDGISLLVEAKKIRPDLPFILMSGHATADDVQRAKNLGACGFLAKPFGPDQLKETLENL